MPDPAAVEHLVGAAQGALGEGAGRVPVRAGPNAGSAHEVSASPSASTRAASQVSPRFQTYMCRPSTATVTRQSSNVGMPGMRAEPTSANAAGPVRLHGATEVSSPSAAEVNGDSSPGTGLPSTSGRAPRHYQDGRGHTQPDPHFPHDARTR